MTLLPYRRPWAASISLILRLPSPLDERDRLNEVVDQLAGIGGGRSMGFGANRVPLAAGCRCPGPARIPGPG